MNRLTGKLSKKERITARRELCRAVRTTPEIASLLEVGHVNVFDISDAEVCFFLFGPFARICQSVVDSPEQYMTLRVKKLDKTTGQILFEVV